MNGNLKAGTAELNDYYRPDSEQRPPRKDADYYLAEARGRLEESDDEE